MKSNIHNPNHAKKPDTFLSTWLNDIHPKKIYIAPTNSFVNRNAVTGEIDITEDILALSCAWYRCRKDKTLPQHIENMLDSKLFSAVTDEDRSMASDIREHFSKKLMVLTLKEHQLTSFRKALSAFIYDDGKKIASDEKVFPLVYRLPEFYTFDKEFESRVKEKVIVSIPDFTRGLQTNKTVTLTPLHSLHKKTKFTDCCEYWLKDTNDHAYLIQVDINNGLRPMWHKQFNNAVSITVSGLASSRTRDEMTYYFLNNWVIE